MSNLIKRSPRSLTIPMATIGALLVAYFLVNMAAAQPAMANTSGAALASIQAGSAAPQAVAPGYLDAGGNCLETGSIDNNDPVQSGRLRRMGLATSCILPTTCDVQGSGPRHYDSYTYTNTSNQTTCVTVTLEGACSGGSGEIYSVAYLGSFDPDNICENYLGDMGSAVNTGSYSVEVPAGETLVVVVHETNGEEGCDSYNLMVSGIECNLPPTASPTESPSAPTATPTLSPTSEATSTATSGVPTETSTAEPPTSSPTFIVTGTVPATSTPTNTSSPVATDTATSQPIDTVTPVTNTPITTLTSTSTAATGTVIASPTASASCLSSGLLIGSIASNDATMVGRLNRDSVAGSCPAPKTCPAVLGSDPLHYDSYTYANTTDQAQCFTVQLDAGSCTGGSYLFSAAYLSGFDPANLCTAYLADIGASPNPIGSYSFSVPAGATFVVVVHELSPGTGCQGYALTVTNCPTAITSCPVTFSDVPPEHTFYPFVRCLACQDILSGYSDGTFRPGNNVTRAQIAKIVSNSAAFSEPTSGQLFQDIGSDHTFYLWVQRLAARGYVTGYPCGGPGEPCGPDSLPYFRPGNQATRGQISKIVSNAAGFVEPPVGQFFQDVPTGSTFYEWIQRLAAREIMSGYPCGGLGEPCGPDNLPYFRPGQDTTRGQAAKIVSNTFFPDCYTAGQPLRSINR